MAGVSSAGSVSSPDGGMSSDPGMSPNGGAPKVSGSPPDEGRPASIMSPDGGRPSASAGAQPRHTNWLSQSQHKANRMECGNYVHKKQIGARILQQREQMLKDELTSDNAERGGATTTSSSHSTTSREMTHAECAQSSTNNTQLAANVPQVSTNDPQPTTSGAHPSNNDTQPTNMGRPARKGTSLKLVKTHTSFRGAYTLEEYRIPRKYFKDLSLFFSEFREFIYGKVRRHFIGRPITSCLRIRPAIKINILKQHVDSAPSRDNFYINIPYNLVTAEDIDEVYDEWVEEALKEFRERMSRTEGSGWIMEKVASFYLEYLTQMYKIQIGSYVRYPQGLRGGDFIFNPSNVPSGSCVLRAVAAYFMHKDCKSWNNIRQRVKSNEYCRNYASMGELQGEITFDQLSSVETENKISLYVYILSTTNDGAYISLARKGGKEFRENIVTTLLLNDKHLVLIKDFDGYTAAIMHRPWEKNDRHCRQCLLNVRTPEKLSEHETSCKVVQNLQFPKEGETLSFKHWGHLHPVEYLGFFDFESMLDPSESQGGIETRHKAIGYSYIVVHREQGVVHKNTYIGENAVDKFVKDVNDQWKTIRFDETRYFKIHMGPDDEAFFQAQTQCYYCSNTFKNGNDKHRHHIHSIEYNNYKYALCQRCNQSCKDNNVYLPLFAHNMSYDLGIMMKEMKQTSLKVRLHSRPAFKYQKVDIGYVRFQDSLSLINGSLATLAEQHIGAGKSLDYTNKMLERVSPAAMSLLTRGKQCLFYDYITDLACLEETQLPSKDKFFNKLKNRAVTDEEYEQAQKVFTTAGCRTLKDYLCLYLMCDVGMLADVFMAWRDTLMSLFKLDCAYYISLPSYAWNAFLLKSRVELDTIHSHEFYDLIRRNLRGGFTSVVRQITMAENKRIDPDFDGEIENNIMYLDFNSLYASCMIMPLPQGGIRKLNEEEKQLFLDQGLSHHSCSGDVGYWVLCDTLPIAPEVAKYTDDLPLVLSHLNINEDMLSHHCKTIMQSEKRKIPRNNTKLVASHLPQKDYFVSLDLLQLLMDLGLEVAAVHDVYIYKQSQFQEDFIRGNIEERSKTQCPIQSKAFKLVNNAIYGKALLNITRYGDSYQYVNKEERFLKLARDPFLKSTTYLDENRAICIMRKETLLVDQPLYLGFQILEIAKKKLYYFWYKVLKPRYGGAVKLLYTDTDSYIFHLECEDLMTELKSEPLVSHLDFSNYPKDHPLYDNSKKGRLNLLKDELASLSIIELVALKPKLYSIKIAGRTTNECRAKGIPTHYAPELTHESYVSALSTPDTRKFECRTISNVKGQMCTIKSSKRGLSSFDDKRYVISNTESVAYGHPLIKELTNGDDVSMAKRRRI